MSVSRALREGVERARLLGHKPGALQWESIRAAVCECVRCGELLAADHDESRHAYGRMLKSPCHGRRMA